MRFSIIVPTLNEEKYLPSLIDSIKRQTFKDFEVIFVDSNSRDKTRAIARNYGKVLIEKRRGIGIARNRGAKEAKGEILFFTNGDTMLSKRLLETYDKEFSKDAGLVAATGPLEPLENVNLLIRAGYFGASVLLAKFALMIGQPSISGSNFAIRKDAFEKAKGFNEHLYTYEDLDLSRRIKNYGKVKFIDSAVVKTSARRILKWGLVKYTFFNASNVLKYYAFKRPYTEYEPIR
ncbi:MAG: glycosyltransferase [Candidatus Micrarchaeaceae archaeon]